MTKRRTPGSIEDAVDTCIETLTAAKARAVTGKSVRLLYYYSDPDDDRSISVKSALALDRAMREAGYGQPIIEAYEEALKEAPSGRAGQCPMIAFVDVAGQISPLAAVIKSAVADKKIDIHERREIIAAAYELIDEARKLIHCVEFDAPHGAVIAARGFDSEKVA